MNYRSVQPLKWSPNWITDHWRLDQTVKKLIAFRSRKFIACPSNPSVLNNASVLWCAKKKSRMRVLMDSCHMNIWIEFTFRGDFTEGSHSSHSRLALLPFHINFAFVVYIFVNFFFCRQQVIVSLVAFLPQGVECQALHSGGIRLWKGFSGRAAGTLVHRTL